MRSGTWDCATTTGEVWIETLRRRWRGSESPRRKEFLRLSKLCSWASRERGSFGKRLFALRMLALRWSDTQPRTSLPGPYMNITLNPTCSFTTIPSSTLTLSCRISPCVTACGLHSCYLLASLTKNSSSPNKSTPIRSGRAHEVHSPPHPPPSAGILALSSVVPRTERTALSDSYMGARDFKHFCRMLGVNRWPAKSLRSLHMMQVTMRHHVGFEPMQRETEAYVHRLRTKSISLQEFLSKGLPDNIIRIRRLLYNYLNTIYPKT
jgi:hypothetical protein